LPISVLEAKLALGT